MSTCFKGCFSGAYCRYDIVLDIGAQTKICIAYLDKYRGLVLIIKSRRWRFFGHMCRLNPATSARRALQEITIPSKRSRGRTCTTYISTIRKDLLVQSKGLANINIYKTYKELLQNRIECCGGQWPSPCFSLRRKDLWLTHWPQFWKSCLKISNIVNQTSEWRRYKLSARSIMLKHTESVPNCPVIHKYDTSTST